MEPCKNHPERLARRRCYFCQSWICPECQLRASGHIFCSLACKEGWERKARREQRVKRRKRLERWLNPLLWWRYPPFLREQWAKRAMLLLWFLLFLHLATIVSILVVLQNQGVRVESISSSPRPLPEESYPRWLTPPENRGGVISGSLAGGKEPGVLLRNGIPVHMVLPGEYLEFREPASLAPTAYHLFPLSLYQNYEQWVSGGASGASLTQARGLSGIALTFDGGSSANQVIKVLRALRETRERATFFLTGEFIARYPELTRMIVASGHEVGNHTYSHPHLTLWEEKGRHITRPGVTREFLQWELLRTEHLFLKTTGTSMAPYWRAPYGEVNEELLRYAEEIGYRHIGWTSWGDLRHSLDVLDWVSDPESPLYESGARMLERILSLASSPTFQGGIVLMHLGLERKGDSLQDHLGELIQKLKEKGVPLYTIGELLALSEGSGEGKEGWQVPSRSKEPGR